MAIANALRSHRLEAVLIGNAAAALQSAPVTTVDVDFMFRPTPANLRKLKAVARELGAVIYRPYYPASGLFRVTNEDIGLQLGLRRGELSNHDCPLRGYLCPARGGRG